MAHEYKTRIVNGQIVIFYEENGYRFSFGDTDPANTEYQKYLEWVAEGNTADEWKPEA